MFTSSSYGAISPIISSPVYRPSAERETRTPAAPSHNYDSVTLSSTSQGENRFRMDMVSRLSSQVRTATTTGDIQSLRQQVASGQYTPDPMAIAGKILFLEG